ncbi:hypothetical protein [Novosphingobium cyanobacteriorum]|uniref:Uncharacterized protein n=1 Tax=Novosphingobium cyanobacteriorum TaxID=3024215 RepID=A0ABT6CHX0_9SPHN|nr:hypothetical protein [Novosphingobium cyanobacteriorum]MDF8333524.1 hypothetical protein [Novosphingobium cyanobacteriorum]
MNRHRPVRTEIRWNGAHYVASCQNCGQPLRRVGKGRWREAPPDESAPA